MSLVNIDPDELSRIVRDEVVREKVRLAVQDQRRDSIIVRILGSPLISVIVAAALGAWLTHYYDETRLKTEHELIQQRALAERLSTRQEIELGKTMEVYESISRLMDRRLWRARRVIEFSKPGSKPEDLALHRAAYREVVNEWNENLNRNLALLERYFGPEARATFDGPLGSSFRHLHELMNRESSGATLEEMTAEADRVNEQMHTFNRGLLAKTR